LNVLLLIPLFAATASTVLAVAILALDPRSRLNRRASLLVAGAAWWALCEVLWSTASDPDTALLLVRLSSFGWVALGPLGLDVLLALAGRPARWERRALPWLYGLSGLYALAILTTDWIHTGMVRTASGWGYELGAPYLLFYPFVTGCLLAGLRAALETLRISASPAERAQLRWMVVGIAVPLVVASVTDGLLPLLGVQVIHLATSSFAFLGATIAWSFHRYGYSLLAPSAFAREILDTVPDGVALLTLDGRIRSVNPELARLLGRGAAELEGLSLAERLRGGGLEQAAEGAVSECQLASFGGDSIPVSAASRLLRDKQGLPLGRVLVLQDTREVADLRRRLVTAGRLAAVGELAAGIAHEINNPIAFVASNLVTLRDYWIELAKRQTGDEGAAEQMRDGEDLIEECLEGIERVKLIVHDVKGFAHAGEDRAFVDVNALLDSALRIAKPLLPPTARLERILSDVPHVRASARHVQQVFLNLLTNAAQAIGPTGTIRVQTERVRDGVAVRFADDGCGMPPEVLERAFDPFFTTKSVGEGTGLGLAISYQIVKGHGGEIRLESAPGRGTRVHVFLRVEGAPEAADGEAQTGGAAGR
jgi:two-component system NtrC family sensor kinase